MSPRSVVFSTVSPAAIESFREKYAVQHTTSCWEWTGATSQGKNGKRYGVVQWTCGTIIRRRRKLYAHRIALAFSLGCDYDDLRGFDAHHKCRNPLCVNPDHLEKVPSRAHARAHRFAQMAEEESGFFGRVEAEASYAP